MRELARRLGRSTRTLRPPDHSDDLEGPASAQQRQFWLLNRFARGVPRYNESIRATVRGSLDEERLARAFAGLVEAHEPLRTTVALRGHALVQRVEPVGAVTVDRADLRTEADPRDAAAARIRACLARPFDVEAETPLRIQLLRVADREWRLVLVVHHIAIDGWSVPTLIDDLTRCFDGASPSELAPPLRYLDYAGWQQQRAVEEDLEHWVNALRGAPARLWPADVRAARSGAGGAAEQRRAVVGRRLLSSVGRLAAKTDATPTMVLLAAFARALGRCAGSDDVVVGLPVANRELSEVTGAVGAFVNTLPIRADLSGEPSFVETVRRVREVALEAYARQHVPFAAVVSALGLERGADARPLVQVLLTLAPDYAPPTRLGGCEVEWDLGVPPDAVPIVDLNLTLAPVEAGLQAVAQLDPLTTDAALVETLLAEWLEPIDRAAEQEGDSVGAASGRDDRSRARLFSSTSVSGKAEPARWR